MAKMSSVVAKVIEFSPEIVATVYTKATRMCFAEGVDAVTKVFVTAVFGYSVMLFIFLLFVVQKVLSRFFRAASDIWVTFRVRSVEAFLLALLFSFQKLVTGAFTLVQCVEILERKVLFIEGHIECYTWWQILIQIYICLNVLPLLFILSHAPVYVQDKTMSVKMFLLNCVFPLPVFLLFRIKQFANSTRHESVSSIPVLFQFATLGFMAKKPKQVVSEDTPEQLVKQKQCHRGKYQMKKLHVLPKTGHHLQKPFKAQKMCQLHS